MRRAAGAVRPARPHPARSGRDRLAPGRPDHAGLADPAAGHAGLPGPEGAAASRTQDARPGRAPGRAGRSVLAALGRRARPQADAPRRRRAGGNRHSRCPVLQHARRAAGRQHRPAVLDHLPGLPPAGEGVRPRFQRAPGRGRPGQQPRRPGTLRRVHCLGPQPAGRGRDHSGAAQPQRQGRGRRGLPGHRATASRDHHRARPSAGRRAPGRGGQHAGNPHRRYHRSQRGLLTGF